MRLMSSSSLTVSRLADRTPAKLHIASRNIIRNISSRFKLAILCQNMYFHRQCSCTSNRLTFVFFISLDRSYSIGSSWSRYTSGSFSTFLFITEFTALPTEVVRAIYKIQEVEILKEQRVFRLRVARRN